MTDLLRTFLNQYPPFYYLSKLGLDGLLPTIERQTWAANSLLFEAGQAPLSWVYTLYTGALSLWEEAPREARLVGQCQPGDLLGCRAALSQTPYRVTARVVEETVLWAIPAAAFFEALGRQPEATLFLARYFALGVPVVRELIDAAPDDTLRMVTSPAPFPALMRTEDVLVPQPVTDIVSCEENTSVQAAAEAIKRRKFGSVIVVDQTNHPVGIVTESDFVRKILASAQSLQTPVSAIMKQSGAHHSKRGHRGPNCSGDDSASDKPFGGDRRWLSC